MADDDKKTFWETLPGTLTGLAAVLTALAGLLALFLKNADKSPSVPATPPAAVATHETREPISPRPVHAHETRTLRLSGMWQDAITGAKVRVVQNEDHLTTATFDPRTGQQVASSDALIDGHSISGTNRWITGASYAFHIKVSQDGSTMAGTYKSNFSNESGSILLKR